VSGEGAPTQAWKTHAALIVVQLAFASQAVEGKIAMSPHEAGGEAIAPAALAMVRMGGAAAAFVLFTQLFELRTQVTAKDHLSLAGLSILGISLNQTLFLIGLRTTTPVSAALLSVTIPVFTAAMAVVARTEKPSWRLALGLGLALVGVLWLTGIHSVDHGAVVVLINSLCYSAYLVLSRRVIVRLGAWTVVTWIFVWGAVLFAPYGVPALVADAPHWTPRGLRFVAYILVMPTIVAYLCNAWALGRSSSTLVTVYIYTQPLIAGLLSWVQLGQAVSERALVAALFILCGVSVVATRPGLGQRAQSQS
jgi:drug/metabolite transporter (DMT)-like permease